MGYETLESQAQDHRECFERIIDSASQNQVRGSNTDDRIRNAVDSAVIVVENCMHDAILTAMDNVVIPQVDMAARSITGSSGNGPNSIVQNPYRRDFTGDTKNTLLRSASSRLDLIFKQGEINEIRDIDNSEDGDFLEARFDYDQRAHAHHNESKIFHSNGPFPTFFTRCLPIAYTPHRQVCSRYWTWKFFLTILAKL